MKQVFLWITCQGRLSHQLLFGTCIPQHLEIRHTSVLAYVSASGQVLPPVLLEGKHLQNSLPVGEVPGTMPGTGSGRMDSELFQMWFFNHFLELAPKRRPLILLLDGHSLHFNTDMIKMAAERASSYSVPPLSYSIHVSQPLDKTCFSPLKQYW